MNLEEKLNFYSQLLGCCHSLYFWEYDPALTLLTPLDEKNELLEYLFRFSKARTALQQYIHTGNPMPLILNDSAGIMWISGFEFSENGSPRHLKDSGAVPKELRKIHIIGPLFANESSQASIRRQLAESDQPLDMRRRVLADIERIPILTSSNLFQYAIMLHYCITGEQISVADLQYQEQDRLHEAGAAPEEGAARDEQHTGAWNADQRLLEAVRTGNLNYASILSEAAQVSTGVRSKRGDAIRSARNSIILFTGLCSRAAIDGGLPPAISYRLCDLYVDLVEGCSTISELTNISHTMFDDYIHRVHRYHTDTGVSRPVRICCDYISMHVTDKISLKELADMCGYTEYYLSRKFKKEVGMTPSDYINQTKIRHARLLLTTTNDTVQEISDTLNFCSRSYFTTVFQNITGESPTEYRAKQASGQSDIQQGLSDD